MRDVSQCEEVNISSSQNDILPEYLKITFVTTRNDHDHKLVPVIQSKMFRECTRAIRRTYNSHAAKVKRKALKCKKKNRQQIKRRGKNCIKINTVKKLVYKPLSGNYSGIQLKYRKTTYVTYNIIYNKI